MFFAAAWGLALAVASPTSSTSSTSSTSAASVARAETQATLRYVVVDGCPDVDAFRAEVRSTLGHDPFVDDAEATGKTLPHLTVTAADFGTRMSVTVEDDGVKDAMRTFVGSPGQCKALLAQAAVAVAVVLDPATFFGASPTSSPSSSSHPAMPDQATTTTTTKLVKSSRSSSWPVIGVSANVDFGATVLAGYGASLHVAGPLPHPALLDDIQLTVELGGRGPTSQSFGSRVSLQAWDLNALLGVCAERDFFIACAMSSGAVLALHPTGLFHPLDAYTFPIGVGPRLGFRSRFLDVAEVWAVADAQIALLQPRVLSTEGDVLWTPLPVWIGVRIGIGLDLARLWGGH